MEVTDSKKVSTKASKLYRIANNKWVTRDLAALDFLLGIPLDEEASIVQSGWRQQIQREQDEYGHSSDSSERGVDALTSSGSKGKWWEKWVKPSDSTRKTLNEESELERPDQLLHRRTSRSGAYASAYVPARRLEGDEAIRVHIPITTETLTKQRSVARQAALREWELQTAHGLKSDQPPMLDGRLFFSAAGSYPISVYSLIRYEPRKEEAILRRQKLEARGGGGSQFVMPRRDWRGVSYRALLPRPTERTLRRFNRFLHGNDQSDSSDDSSVDSSSSSSSDDSDVYVPGLLDDPEMTMGRHRNVMIGDRVTGPIVSSTIQFVKPALLKAELNKQFRDRFDGWEPPRSARKYIGARVIDGEYKLLDPAEEYDDRSFERRNRQGSVTSMSSSTEGPGEKQIQIRMPPSLTLSKIRSLKRQALVAAVKAKLEIGTVALACVYFERLCLDCRVDKSNRRLAFAACLLLAAKLNEPNVGLVTKSEKPSHDENISNRLQSLIKPNKRSSNMFASLLEFFTSDWNISLKNLFDGEFGVFAALGFSLHATPSQVAFHFRRLMKTLERNPLSYLGKEMYEQWQEALSEEEKRRKERERHKEARKNRKEERLLNLQIEIENEVLRRKKKNEEQKEDRTGINTKSPRSPSQSSIKDKNKKGGIKLPHFFSMRRTMSQERVGDIPGPATEHSTRARQSSGITHSPSMPVFPVAEPLLHHTAGQALPPLPSMEATHSWDSHQSGMVAVKIPPREDEETIDDGSADGSDKGITV